MILSKCMILKVDSSGGVVNLLGFSPSVPNAFGDVFHAALC